jgi:hypothetical protein
MQLVQKAMTLKLFKVDAVLDRLGDLVGIDLRQQRCHRRVRGDLHGEDDLSQFPQ